MTPEAFVERLRALSDLSHGEIISKHEWHTLKGWLSEVKSPPGATWQVQNPHVVSWEVPTEPGLPITSRNGASNGL